LAMVLLVMVLFSFGMVCLQIKKPPCWAAVFVVIG
jgi:hypothetical protein